VKVLATGQKKPVKIPSGPRMTARKMAAAVNKAVAGWDFDGVSIGYPGRWKRGSRRWSRRIWARGGWGLISRRRFGKPVKITNDAAMQALGSYRGRRMLFLGLGTGLGSTLIAEGMVAPLELAHLLTRKKTYEDYVGDAGLKRAGKKKWRRQVETIVGAVQGGVAGGLRGVGRGQRAADQEAAAGHAAGQELERVQGRISDVGEVAADGGLPSQRVGAGGTEGPGLEEGAASLRPYAGLRARILCLAF